MKRSILIVLFALYCGLLLLPKLTYAIEDPLSLSNNKVGIHILFPSELELAATLVNSNGGDWGYVTIPIQEGDKDMEKWQKFMDEAKRLHIIPIIRLATQNYYFDTKVWKKPSHESILDFANFLNSLDWPTKNRYVIIFNEVNRSDEWEGKLNPEEYAHILSYASSAFKSLDDNFFIISSGLDNAAPNKPGEYMNQYDYMIAMDKAVPGIFGQIDGLGSHSYPNPGFKQAPYKLTNQNIGSFNFEKNLAYKLSGKNLPIFITETGWSRDVVPENQIATYFKYAFENVWSDKNVIAVTSFLLQAGAGPFSQFSLVNADGKCNNIFTAISDVAKTKGNPTINSDTNAILIPKSQNLPVKTFPKKAQYKSMPLDKVNAASVFFKWLFKIST